MKTIKSKSDISLLFDRGRRLSTPDLILIVLRNEGQHDQYGRVAFIAGKKLGNAVWRNRAKRRMRAVCQELGGPFSGYDVVFLAKKRVATSAFDEIVDRTRKTLDKAGVLAKDTK